VPPAEVRVARRRCGCSDRTDPNTSLVGCEARRERVTYTTLDNGSSTGFVGFPLGSGDVVGGAVVSVADSTCTSGEVGGSGSDWGGGDDVRGKAGGVAGVAGGGEVECVLALMTSSLEVSMSGLCIARFREMGSPPAFLTWPILAFF
jgi:hypothetical protein